MARSINVLHLTTGQACECREYIRIIRLPAGRQAYIRRFALYFFVFRKIKLKNGLRIILAPIEGAKSVTVLLLVKAGSKYETKAKNGISHFLEHMFFKGTHRRPSTADIASELDSVGGAYNAFTGEEYTGYWAKVDAAHLGLALDIVSDIYLNSKLDSSEIEKEKGVIIEEINMRQDVPMVYVGVLWNQLLYGNQPAGWDVAGTKENIRNIKRQDFVNYLKNHYLAEKTIVCLAGQKDKIKLARGLIEKYFRNIRTGRAVSKKKTSDFQDSPGSLLYFKETDQTHFILGVRAYHALHKDRHALGLLSTILGGYMSSRLWQEIREKRSLAYYIGTTLEFFTDVGFLGVRAGVDNARVLEAVETILFEFKKILKDGPSESELERAKNYIKGSTRLSLESSDEVANFLGAQEVLKGEILTPEQLFYKIDKASAVDIKRVAQNIFRPQKLNLAMIGPSKDTSKIKATLKLWKIKNNLLS